MNDEIKDKINDYIENYVNKWQMFGVIKVIKENNVLYENSFGYASIEYNIKNNMNTLFTLASISKQFTAFAIMILVDKHLINLDTEANLYLPKELQINKEITVRSLLSHTSGLANIYNFDEDFFGNQNRLNYEKVEYFNKYINRELIFAPTTRFDYNNSNYNILAWIIEKVSGISYEQFLKVNIFDPLDMTYTCVDDSLKIINNKATNYIKDFDKDVKAPYADEKYSIGAGAIVSCVDDLYKWYQALKNRKIISEMTYIEYFKENLEHYCFGLFRKEEYGTVVYEHGGDNLGIANIISYDFINDTFIVILSNNEVINQYFLHQAILDIIHMNKPKNIICLPENDNLKIDLDKYCGEYLKNKLVLEKINNKLYFNRFNNTIHIELYPVDNNKFARRYSHQINPYEIKEVD